VKLLYAIAFAFFPLATSIAAPAQSPDITLLTALCWDDYYEDTAGQCSAISAAEVLTIEAVIAKYAVTDDELLFLLEDDPEDTPVGSIEPRSEAYELAGVRDDQSKVQPATEQGTVAARAVPAEPQLELKPADECADEAIMTGPTARLSAPLGAKPVEADDTTE